MGLWGTTSVHCLGKNLGRVGNFNLFPIRKVILIKIRRPKNQKKSGIYPESDGGH